MWDEISLLRISLETEHLVQSLHERYAFLLTKELYCYGNIDDDDAKE